MASRALSSAPPPDPDLVDFVKALARAAVARDIAAARNRGVEGQQRR